MVNSGAIGEEQSMSENWQHEATSDASDGKRHLHPVLFRGRRGIATSGRLAS